MSRKISGILLITVLLAGQLSAHSGKPRYHVIIDTDGALDDMRAISMFLSGNDIRVLAITCSQGTLLPDSVVRKVSSLLSDLHHEGIRIGKGSGTGQTLPPWSAFAQGISWGNAPGIQNGSGAGDAIRLLDRTTRNYREKITLVALGSLKTYADWIRSDPRAAGRIDRILWYNGPALKEGFNYRESPGSYDYIVESGVELIEIADQTGRLSIDQDYSEMLLRSGSSYARQITKANNQAVAGDGMNQEHLCLMDDMVPLYLTAPLLFDTRKGEGVTHATIRGELPGSFVYETIIRLLESAATTTNRVFNSFPLDSSLYRPGYVKIMDATISNFGLVEWKAVCMTNEIHGHTGIYSIIGAKMGVRAMEYFNVGINNLTVTTFAGSVPPLSCLNDGIQISTGATIGQGLIIVSDSTLIIPTVIFEFNGLKVKMSLRAELAEQVRRDIEYGEHTYGTLTGPYWLFIEKLAIRYWSDFSRWEICDIIEI